jgi:glycosyltransferase involved in cell wall biosynthesis
MTTPGQSDRPALLCLTRAFPYRPLFGGATTYSRGVIEALATACDLTVLAATNGEQPTGTRRRGAINWILVPETRRIAALSLPSRLPQLVWREATGAYHGALDALLDHAWDGVILDHFATTHALDKLVAWRRRHPAGRILYIAHEHEWTARREKYARYGGDPLRRLAMTVDAWKIGRWERRVLRAVDVISLINGGERALFEATVPNGRYVTTTPGYDGPIVPTREIDATVPRRIAVLGGYGTLHKQHILTDWLAASAERFARLGIELDVIGDVGEPLRRTLAERYPTVRFCGFVDDLAAHLQTCRLGVVPDTVGRGVKIRLASYIFARVPMAAYKGAIDGLPIVAHRHFAEAPGLPQLVDLCARMIDDFDWLNRLQHGAFAACEQTLDWPTRGRALVAALGDLPLREQARRRAPAPVLVASA